MATVWTDEADRDGAPLSLYLELAPGSRADMDVVARTSIRFVEMVREVAYIIDPALEVRVELESGTEGSLGLNTIIKDLRDPTKRKRTLWAVAIAIGIFFGPDIKEWAVGTALDSLVEADGFSEEERRDIEEILRRVVNENVAQAQRQDVFKELERDPNVTGVGTTTHHGERPNYVVPRREFPKRAGGEAPPPPIYEGRYRRDRLWVTLVSPVLTSAHRRWKVRIGDEEYGVYMEDEKFLEAVLHSGRIPMVEGIELEVTIDLHEEYVGGETWSLSGYHRVQAVHAVRAPRVAQLPLLPDE